MQFLGAFAELRKVTVSFFMPVRPSFRMEQLSATGQIPSYGGCSRVKFH
jgi:hypothetical protein